MSRNAATDLRRQALSPDAEGEANPLVLVEGSRIAVIGGGPAGALFAYFLRRLADSVDLHLDVHVFEPRSFNHDGPEGCNHCGGIVSESLVQLLAIEGVNIPAAVVRRGIESYMLHTDIGGVRVDTPVREKRIASVFRGNGPRGCPFTPVAGLDQFLLDLSRSVGAITVRKLVTGLRAHGDRIEVSTSDGVAGDYDLVAVATGVNSQLLRTLRDAVPKYEPPGSRRTFICEFDLGEEAVRRCMGESMHVFVLDIPRLEFAALIPKGRFVTLCVLGDDVDDALVERLLATSIVSRCFPGSVVPPAVCHCFPRINTVPAVRPFADRMVWIGDSGVTRLYKDGIGSAYRTAKAAARTAIFRGISARDFERYFWPECRALAVDNRIGRVIFGLAAFVQRARFVRRGILRMTAIEQTSAGDRPMSSALWDLFSGSAPYREILRRVARPGFASTLAWHVIASNVQSTIAAGRRQTQPGKRDGA